ncbi:MAG: alpha-2-macroglobulin family protein [Saprospiraceae bacterium]
MNRENINFNFDQEWSKVDSLEKIGQISSALEIVDSIFDYAKQNSISDQKIKAIFYIAKYNSTLKEDNLIIFQNDIIKEINESKQPEKSILQSILAEFYDKYTAANFYKLSNRTTIENDEAIEFNDWSISKLIEQSNKLYTESISEKNTLEKQYDSYKLIFTNAVNTDNKRQSLYELLAHRALDHFKNDRNYLPKSTIQFKIDNEEYFSPSRQFVKLDLDFPEKEDYKFITLKLYQELEKYNLEKEDFDDLIDVQLDRLQFVKTQYLFSNGNKLFEQSLKEIIKSYPSKETTAEAMFDLASLYNSISSNGNPEYKWKNKEALELCNTAISKFPESYGAEKCEVLKNDILATNLTANTELVNLPDENLICKIDYKNIGKLYFKLAKLDKNKINDIRDNNRDIEKYISKFSYFKSWNIILPNDGDLMQHSCEIKIDPLDIGNYFLIISDNADFDKNKGILSYSVFTVSNIAYWLSKDNSQNELIVVNRKSGKPIENAIVELYEYQWNRQSRTNEKVLYYTGNTDFDGRLVIPVHSGYKNLHVVIYSGNDILNLENNINVNSYENNTTEKATVIFFTDRNIYRPGQIVYFKGLVINYDAEKIPHIIPNYNSNVALFDANNQKVTDIKLKTNDFGTFNGSFVLPSSGLTGNMSIRELTTNSSVSFKVEEYKRPNFEIVFDKYMDQYKLGDTIFITGKAISFSGAPLQNAKVDYNVSRKTNFIRYYSHRMFIPASSDIILDNGSLETDQNGNFSIPVNLYAEDIDIKKLKPNFVFYIEATVTDNTGETHSENTSIFAGSNPVNISLSVNENNKTEDSISIKINSKNNSGIKIPSDGNITIVKLIEPQGIFRKRLWEKPDTFVYSESEFKSYFPYYSFNNEDEKSNWKTNSVADNFLFNTGKSEEYKINLSPGEYKIELSYHQGSDDEIKIYKYISVYSDEKNPYGEILSSYTENKIYNIGDTADIYSHSSVNNLNVFSSFLKKNNNIIKKEWSTLSNKNNDIIKIDESSKGGIVQYNSYVYNNRYYENTVNIPVPWTEKELEFEFSTFRSILYPGQDEEWKIKIKGKNKDKFIAEILATMYDMSLDDIYNSYWYVNVNYPHTYYLRNTIYGFQNNFSTQIYPDNFYRDYSNPVKIYRNINWFGFEISRNIMMKRARATYATESIEYDSEMTMSASPPMMENGMADNASIVTRDENDNYNDEKTINTEENNKEKTISVRSNLNETVFFYPEINTDENGDFTLKFKMNEALTKWKLRIFAHTKDLKYGISEKEIITKKDLMITPNNPRFVRVNDDLIFNAKIDNLTENNLSGKSWIEIYDAESMELVESKILNDAKTKNFNIKANGSETISWDLKFDDNSPNLLVYRFYAQSGNFSDAVEGYLPVLSEKKLITESIPLWVNGNEEKTFVFKSLKNSSNKDLKNISFTIESTSNPAWLCVQSLPYITKFRDENATNIADAIFANSLALKIIADNPKIKNVYEKWKLNADKSLKSPLQKNQDLKNMLLEETPWVVDALNEEENIKNISLLFDENKTTNDLQMLISKLKSIQNPDGGFPWFKGGYSNRYISQYIIEIIGKLQKLNALKKSPEIDKIVNSAFDFIDYKAIKDYNDLMISLKNGHSKPEDDHLGAIDIHLLYIMNLHDRKDFSPELQKVIDYYYWQSEKYWNNKSLYLKAMISIILRKANHEDLSNLILKSLEEQSIYNEELGRYWKENSGYNWWQLNIEVQSLLIEAFGENGKYDKLVNELRIWLIKNKQTNQWENSKASVSAIYALLDKNQDILQENKQVSIFLNDKNITDNIDKNDIEAGTGYFRKQWQKNDINPDFSEIKISNPNKNIAWGAVYWQYLQDIDKIESFSETPLKISKQTYLVKQTPKGELLTNIDGKLNPGDILKVQIKIEVDRPMEFIQISDQRASCLEPTEQISRYNWQGGLGYYQNPKDTKTNFFIDYLPRGNYIFEYSLFVTQSGSFSNGIAEIQSYYAPEFNSHSGGMRIEVDNK